MPTYAYRCASCGHTFEQFQRMSDDPLSECPECAGQVKRVIHPVGVVFKGSGWYITDSRASRNGTAGTDGETANGEVKDKKEPKADADKVTKSEAKSKTTEAKSAAD